MDTKTASFLSRVSILVGGFIACLGCGHRSDDAALYRVPNTKRPLEDIVGRESLSTLRLSISGLSCNGRFSPDAPQTSAAKELVNWLLQLDDVEEIEWAEPLGELFPIRFSVYSYAPEGGCVSVSVHAREKAGGEVRIYAIGKGETEPKLIRFFVSDNRTSERILALYRQCEHSSADSDDEMPDQ